MNTPQTIIKQQEITLEGYKDLSTWNRHDAQAVLSFDKIFLPLTIGGWITSLAKAPSLFMYAYIGGVILLTFWVFLSWRYRLRIAERFCIMKKIERRLGFQAHLLICGKLEAPRDITLRLIFYCVAVISGLVILESIIAQQLEKWPDSCCRIICSFCLTLFGLISFVIVAWPQSDKTNWWTKLRSWFTKHWRQIICAALVCLAVGLTCAAHKFWKLWLC